jgi:hypothetical protein
MDLSIMANLPNELIENVIRQGGIPAILQWSRVSRRWNNVCQRLMREHIASLSLTSPLSTAFLLRTIMEKGSEEVSTDCTLTVNPWEHVRHLEIMFPWDIRANVRNMQFQLYGAVDVVGISDAWFSASATMLPEVKEDPESVEFLNSHSLMHVYTDDVDRVRHGADAHFDQTPNPDTPAGLCEAVISCLQNLQTVRIWCPMEALTPHIGDFSQFHGAGHFSPGYWLTTGQGRSKYSFNHGEGVLPLPAPGIEATPQATAEMIDEAVGWFGCFISGDPEWENAEVEIPRLWNDRITFLADVGVAWARQFLEKFPQAY